MKGKTMLTLRKAEERGHADLGWLDSHHSFSFSSYYDERYMGYRDLRVINDDRVLPGHGFDTHPHKDMEIISYVLDGALAHKDSMGNGSVIHAGEIQKMSAGSGVLHSEFNNSKNDMVHFLQIWITPKTTGIKPSYGQIYVSKDEKLDTFKLIASPDGIDGSLSIHQDARIYATVLSSESKLEFAIEKGRHIWVQVASGKLEINGQKLSTGDGLAVSDESVLKITGNSNAEILIFDLV